MPFFIDTSALFKRDQSEKGTATVTRILEDHGQPLFISSITIVEIISNLKRLFAVDKITTEEQFQLQRASRLQLFLPQTSHKMHSVAYVFDSEFNVSCSGICTAPAQRPS